MNSHTQIFSTTPGTIDITRLSGVTLALVGSLALAACSSSATTDSPAAEGQVVTRGSIALIDASGRVTVSGRQFSIDDSRVLIDDSPGSVSSLSTGMQVVVQSQDGMVTALRYDENVKGPVDGVELDGTLSVLGQTVLIDASTVIDDSFSGAFSQGDIVEVSGIRAVDDVITASYIEVKQQPLEYEVRGVVRDHNPTSMTFRLGGLTVDYSQARLDDLYSTTISNDMEVEVKDESATYEPGSFFLQASKVEFYNASAQGTALASASQQGSSGSSSSTSTNIEFEVEAIITGIDGGNRFRLDNVWVNVMDNTRFRHGSAGDIALNRRVEVEGLLLANGELQAWEVEFEDGDSDYYDSSRHEFSGDDDDDRDDDSSNSSGSGDDSGGDDDNRSEVEIEGVLEAMDATTGMLRIGGIEIFVGSATQFEDRQDRSIDRTTFFSQLVVGQSIVKVKWRGFTGYDQAPREVDIES